MKRWIGLRLLLAGLIGWMLGGRAEAVPIFDNFGPEDDYQTDIGWTVSGSDSALQQDWDVAMAFTPEGKDYHLEGIEVAINQVYEDGETPAGANELDLYLMTSVGNRPGTVLESWHLMQAMGKLQTGVLNSPIKVPSTLNPVLREGNQYWVVVSGGKDVWAVWNYNTTGDLGTPGNPGTQVRKRGGGPWIAKMAERGAFRVTGTPRKDPALIPYLLFGLGVWSHLQGQGDGGFKFRVTNNNAPPASTPEAPSYLLLGLGVWGLMIWRRRKGR